jgi:hypothetical protein
LLSPITEYLWKEKYKSKKQGVADPWKYGLKGSVIIVFDVP